MYWWSTEGLTWRSLIRARCLHTLFYPERIFRLWTRRRLFLLRVCSFVRFRSFLVKKVKESRKCKKGWKGQIFFFKKALLSAGFLDGSTGSLCRRFILKCSSDLLSWCFTRTFVETTNVWFVVFVEFPPTLRFSPMTALPVHRTYTWACTQSIDGPVQPISCHHKLL